MRLALLLLISSLAWAQTTPDLSGVWKANKDKSKTARPMGEAEQYVWIHQDGAVVKLQEMTEATHSERRSNLTYDTSAPESVNMMRGEKVPSKASFEDGSLVVETTFKMGDQSMTMHEKWTLGEDKNTLTEESSGGRGPGQTIVYDRQPDTASDVFTKPPRMAKDVYENVKVLDVPAYQLIDQMEGFAQGLGVRCSFCHVEGKFSSDEKRPKQFARKMYVMTTGINHDLFRDHPRVTCYTCHRGKEEPLSHPAE